MKLSGPDQYRYTLICFPAPNYKKKTLKNFNVMICEWIYLGFLCPKDPRYVLEGGCCYSLWQISFQNRFHIRVYFWRVWTLNSCPGVLASFGGNHSFVLGINRWYHFLIRITIDKFAGCVLFCLKKFYFLSQTSKCQPFWLLISRGTQKHLPSKETGLLFRVVRT